MNHCKLLIYFIIERLFLNNKYDASYAYTLDNRLAKCKFDIFSDIITQKNHDKNLYSVSEIDYEVVNNPWK